MLVVGLVVTAGGVVMVVVVAAAETGRRWWWHSGGLRKVENFWSSTTRFPITLADIFSKCTDRTTRSKLNYFRQKKKKKKTRLFFRFHTCILLSFSLSFSRLLAQPLLFSLFLCPYFLISTFLSFALYSHVYTNNMHITRSVWRVTTVVLFPVLFSVFSFLFFLLCHLPFSRAEAINIVEIGSLSFASIIQFVAAINADTTTNRITFARWKVANLNDIIEPNNG